MVTDKGRLVIIALIRHFTDCATTISIFQLLLKPMQLRRAARAKACCEGVSGKGWQSRVGEGTACCNSLQRLARLS